MVETLLVLYNLVEYGAVQHFGGTGIDVEEVVRVANRIFLQDHRDQDGDAMLCCAAVHPDELKARGESVCGAPAGVCKHFYDSAPSGTYGTMCYILRACCAVLEALPNEGTLECPVS